MWRCLCINRSRYCNIWCMLMCVCMSSGMFVVHVCVCKMVTSYSHFFFSHCNTLLVIIVLNSSRYKKHKENLIWSCWIKAWMSESVNVEVIGFIFIFKKGKIKRE